MKCIEPCIVSNLSVHKQNCPAPTSLGMTAVHLNRLHWGTSIDINTLISLHSRIVSLAVALPLRVVDEADGLAVTRAVRGDVVHTAIRVGYADIATVRGKLIVEFLEALPAAILVAVEMGNGGSRAQGGSAKVDVFRGRHCQCKRQSKEKM